VDLLLHQRLGGCHEADFASRVPAVEIAHHHGRDEGLPQARGQAHERVVLQTALHDAELVLAEGELGVVPAVSELE
jgi:hypothetical protein